MPRKRKKRSRAQRSAILPWVILAASVGLIGFACSRPVPTSPVAHTAARPIAHATPRRDSAAPTSGGTPAATALQHSTPEPLVTSLAPASPNVRAPATTTPPDAIPAGKTPIAESKNAPRLALIIDDCGQWLDTERGFIALPIALTLSVLPDVPFNHLIEREAADGNKGVMLHLPMETLSGLNPGPGKITTEMDDAAIAQQVGDDLANVDLARGVNNHEGSKATANARVMNDLMTVLAERGRFFIDSRTNGASVAEHVAAQHGVATAGRDIFLDNRADVEYTERQLRLAAAIAKRDGSAIAIGHPRPTTLAAVRAMIPELQADGIVFALAENLTH